MQKKRTMWRLIVVLVVALTVIWLGACSAPEPSEPKMEDTVDGEAMLQESCTQCHNLERTTSEQKTREQWEQTVDNMIQKGSKVADKEALVDYLAETYGP